MRFAIALFCCVLAAVFFLYEQNSDSTAPGDAPSQSAAVEKAVNDDAGTSSAPSSETSPAEPEEVVAATAAEKAAPTETTLAASADESKPAPVAVETIPATALIPADRITESKSDSESEAAEQTNLPTKQGTHKQSTSIEMTHGGSSIGLNTFALDHSGNLLACVSQTTSSGPGYLQTYSPAGEMLRETELDFAPTAVNEAPDKTVIVAGAGKVARVSADGELMSVIDSPHLSAAENLEETIKADAEKQMKDRLSRYQTMVDQVNKRIAAIEEKPEEDRTSRDEVMMKSLPAQKKMYEQQLEQMKSMYSRSYSAEAMLARKKKITSVAVTSKDIFITSYALEGSGYEMWRTNLELSEPKQIMTGLRGCCGQCDVQAAGDNIAIAENSKFKVGIYDRDGERITEFGERDRASVNGFGSCCNPMNVRCCKNGDILTGESSVGNIKRFSATGEYLGLVGKAKISGGCKHVALAHDEERNRYYMMNVSRDHICVLVPLSEAPELTEDELIAQRAVEAHGAKFLGTWEIAKPVDDGPAVKTQKRTVTVVKMVDGKRVEEEVEVRVPSSSRYTATSYTFHPDGRLEMKGSAYASSSSRWEALSHDETSIRLAFIRDEVHSYDFKIEFGEEDSATISMMYRDTVRGSSSYKRTCCAESCDEKANAKEAETESATPAIQTTLLAP